MKKLFFGNRFGTTLVEMVVSTITLTIVLLAAGTVYISAVKEFKRVSNEARIQAEAFRVLDHIYLNLIGATGIVDPLDPFPSLGSDHIEVTVNDYDPPHNVKNIKYTVESNKVYFYDPSSTATPEIIAQDVTGGTDPWSLSLKFKTPLTVGGNVVKNYITVEIAITKGSMSKTYVTGITLRGMNST